MESELQHTKENISVKNCLPVMDSGDNLERCSKQKGYEIFLGKTNRKGRTC